MATNFMQGFLSGYESAGGVEKLSSWAGRNIAGGKYYDPYNDPYYLQQLERARAINTPSARQAFIGDWGQYVDTGGEDINQYLFGIKPEPKTMYGMGEEEIRSLLLNAALEGREIPENVYPLYQETFGHDISPVVNMFMTEEEGPGFKDFLTAYMGVRDAPKFAQEQFMEEYPGFVGEATHGQLFPEQEKSVLDRISLGLRQLSPEEALEYQEAGYIVTETPEYPGWYALQEGLPPDETLKGIDLLQAGFIPLNEEQLLEYSDAGYLTIEAPGYPGYYSIIQGPPQEDTKLEGIDLLSKNYVQLTPKEITDLEELGYLVQEVPGYPDWYKIGPQIPVQGDGYDYGAFNLEQLLSLILADEVYSSEEQPIWKESPYAVFGEPETLQKALYPTKETVGETAGTDFGFDIKFSDYRGLTPDGRPVYQNVRGGRYAVNEDGTLEDWTGQLVMGEQELSVSDAVGHDEEGRTLYVNDNDLLVYSDGSIYTDTAGNQYIAYLDPETQITDFIPFTPDFRSGEPPEIPEKGPSVFERVTSWFSGKQGTKPDYAITDVINALKETLGTTDDRELLSALESPSFPEERKKLIEETYGRSFYQILVTLRMLAGGAGS